VRVLGLDLGSRRIGVAVSDSTRTLASPVTVITRGRRIHDDHAAIAALAREYHVGEIVVGLPLALSGQEGPAAQSVRAEVAQLERLVDVPVTMCDERFTTVAAERNLSARGVKTRRQRPVIDQEAATVLLQGWLDQVRTK
jgi:putative Holliday junction resolvase